MREHAVVAMFDTLPADFDHSAFDVCIYQIGNNAFHEGAYRAALLYPGIAVLHESNLHHLIADITIKRGCWDDYMREVEYDGGSRALEFAQRVRALEIGPDYEGVPMLRRLLETSRAVVVHSRAVEEDVRRAGFQGPIARIQHGAWVTEGDRMGLRHRLGLDERDTLIGIFGYLKPYKRIAESLRAFRRLLKVAPDVKMILVGEPHPEFPVASLLDGLGISASVRLLGYAPIEDFTGYLSACDIVLNLRFPTVGESSGSLLRAFGLGKPVIVSNVGSFAEFPDDICLKAPVDAGEEDHLFEYLNLLVSRPDLARAMGKRARAWVERECCWDLAARRYLEFAQSVSEGRPWPSSIPEPQPATPAATEPECTPEPAQAPSTAAYLRTWAIGQQSNLYLDYHLTRLDKTLAITPPGGTEDRILEMGAYLQITPALKLRLGYGEVRGCYLGPSGQVDRRVITSSGGETFECEIELFDAEADPFPYPDGYFATVLCGELIEHLTADPMHMMAEINRVLRPGGHLVLTTPNIASMRAIAAILEGFHPGFFPPYIRPSRPGEEVEARHSREYTPKEISHLLSDSGFEVTRLETGPFRDAPRPEHGWVEHLLERYQFSAELRGDGIYAVGRKATGVRKRYPAWLYEGGE
jgi:glycosyltransferase involved in cell wall biosynthesis/SAM-dependent methyltransferase